MSAKFDINRFVWMNTVLCYKQNKINQAAQYETSFLHPFYIQLNFA